ncbi:glycosyltransferase [Microbacterium testaceum]|uniref:glycosyltransferase n=1 Tax=Microbacterium testaceum TaxID=2033 RepID=UPI00187BEE3D|nr:glycosyltransferase [Microbacterium testaceum]
MAIDPTVRTLKPPELGLIEAPIKQLKGLTVQKVPMRCRLGSQVLIMDLNPRMPQVWLTTVGRRLLRKKTLLWGHAWPRKGRDSPTARVRLLLARLSDGVITYTHTQASEVRDALPGKAVIAAPNAIDREDDFLHDGGANRSYFTYVGRLVASKRVDLLVRAFAMARLPFDVGLLLVGEGPDAASLRKLVTDLGVEGRVVFAGHVSDRRELRKVYRHTLASVSPGYVGLSLIQSLSFGVPMIYAGGEDHSPEIEAATDDNSVCFAMGDPEALANAMVAFYGDAASWDSRGPQIAIRAKRTYSAETMASGLEQALRGSSR